jgi:hypothetical protein
MATNSHTTSFNTNADFTIAPGRIVILLSDPRICEPRMRQLPISLNEAGIVSQLRCADICRYSSEKFCCES